MQIQTVTLSDDTPAALSGAVRSAAREACEAGGHEYREMVSGAAHDCMNMSTLCPAGLIFIPSVRGVSHHPDEESREEHLLAGVDVLYRTVIRLAGA
ncbi:MAG: M20/M25/M40 family metallo-hydrolase [Bacilli bacterium]